MKKETQKQQEERQKGLKKYGKDFGIKSEVQLDSYLRKNGYSSLADLLKQ